jgi:hypothetical protein
VDNREQWSYTGLRKKAGERQWATVFVVGTNEHMAFIAGDESRDKMAVAEQIVTEHNCFDEMVEALVKAAARLEGGSRPGCTCKDCEALASIKEALASAGRPDVKAEINALD